jgi:hypothetical protein
MYAVVWLMYYNGSAAEWLMYHNASAAAVQEPRLQLSRELVVLRNTVLGLFVVPPWHLLIGQVVRTGVVIEAFPSGTARQGPALDGLPYQYRPRLRISWLKLITTAMMAASLAQMPSTGAAAGGAPARVGLAGTATAMGAG